ncbi:MAG: glycosyltransferase family 39 protein, partial [candidate division Zixibacteria bacterium]|nr:glycosyltransferase family 39 protein [candidate division Zixibacteria bacterium]
VLFRITDESLYGVRLLQIILGSLLPILVYLLGLRLLDRRIAYWAGGVCVIYPTFIYYDNALLITSIMTLLTSLLVLQLLRCETKPNRVASFVIAGLLLGLAGLARPNILLLGPALLVWIWLVIRPQLGARKALVRYLIIAAASFIVVLPVTVRNYVVADDFVFIAWQGGFNFFIGNNQESNGWSATVPGIDVTWEGGYREAIAIAEESEGRTLKRSEVSNFWYGLAWQEIRSDPSAFIGLLFRKLRLFLNGYEIPNNQNIYLARKLGSIVQPLMFSKWLHFPFGVVAPLAVIGLVLSLTQWRKFLPVYLMLGSYLLTLLLFFLCARFRQPMMPFMILFAVYAVFRLIEFKTRRQGKNLALALFMLTLLLVESNHDALGLDQQRVAAEDQLVVGNAYLAQNNLAGAEMEYKRGLSADSTLAPLHNNLGLIKIRRNRVGEAVAHFTRATRVDPGYLESYMNLASAYLETGQLEATIRILEQAAVRHPRNDQVHLKLGAVYAEAGRTEEAIRFIRRSLELNPDSEAARQALREIQTTGDKP